MPLLLVVGRFCNGCVRLANNLKFIKERIYSPIGQLVLRSILAQPFKTTLQDFNAAHIITRHLHQQLLNKKKGTKWQQLCW